MDRLIPWKPPNFWIDMKVVKNLKELWKLIIERREEIMSTVAKKIVPAQRFKTEDFFRCATHGKG